MLSAIIIAALVAALVIIGLRSYAALRVLWLVMKEDDSGQQ